MKVLGWTFLCALLSVSLSAQITFRTTDLPRQVGVDSWRAHVDTAGKDVRSLLGAKGGPHRWDFSYPAAGGEDVHRMDVVARDDGDKGGDFPQAAYAERVTRAKDGCQNWSYHKVIPGGGRFYYGMRDDCKAPQPDVVFDAPTIDLPEDIAYGQSWQREVDWQDTIDAGFIVLTVAIHFTNETVVDAYGTVVLPEIGDVPALRLNEVNTYVTTDLTFGIPIDTQIFRNYVWLVPGIGKAVHIISEPKTTTPPEDFATAKTVLRVFESNRYPPIECQSVKNLQIRLKGREVFLSWDKDSAARRYRIDACEQVTGESSWQLLAELTDSYRFEAVLPDATSRFFRVLGCR